MMIDYLIDSRIFQELSLAEIETISNFCELIQIDDGVLVLQENDREYNNLYILALGSLEIVSQKDENISNEVTISVQEKDLFGEIAWLTQRGRTASVRAHGSATIVQINGEALNQYIKDYPKAGCVILRAISVNLCDRVKSTNILVKQILWNQHI